LQPAAIITSYAISLRGKRAAAEVQRQKVLQSFLPISARDALTSCRGTDKNAHFLRQAVSFASRNGRSAILALEDKLSKDQRF
jgi:hypothetical protein